MWIKICMAMISAFHIWLCFPNWGAQPPDAAIWGVAQQNQGRVRPAGLSTVDRTFSLQHSLNYIKLNYIKLNYIKFVQFYNLQLIIMQQSVNHAREQKQAYIIQNIDPNYYDDFHDFCTSQAGQINIDAWPIEYVHQLVSKFKEFLIKRNQQDQNHNQKSFAIYQTTSGQNPIGKFQKAQMNQILSSLEQANVIQPPPVKPMKKKQQIGTPEPTKQTEKQIEKKNKSDSKSKQTKPAKISAVDLLDSVFEQTGDKKKDQVNRSFFNSSNFWDVPKLDEQQRQSKLQIPEQKKQKNPSSPVIGSPKQQFKSIKLNLNVNELNKKQKKQQNPRIQVPKAESGNSKNAELDAFDYGNSSALNFNNDYFSINMIKPTAVSPNLKSQFDTFSEMAQQEIKKKKNNTMYSNPQHAKNSNKNVGSTIKLKQVKQLKPTSALSGSNSNLTTKSKSSNIIARSAKTFPNDFVDQVSCVRTAVRPILNDQQLQVQIKTFQIIQRSMFSSNYLMYHMKVLPIGRVCKRNYQDFSRFKTTLYKFYPGIQLPYLEKDSWRADTSPQYALKQAQMLQYFMADILSHPQLRNSRITQQFLTLQDHKKMKRKFEQYDRMTKLKSIEQLCLIQGKVEVALTENQRIYNQTMAKFLVKIESNLQKYKKFCESLSNTYQQAMTTMLNIDDVIKQMQNQIENFNKNVSIKQIQCLDNSLKKIRDNYKQNYFRMKFQKRILDEQVLPFVKYEKQNCNASKDIIEICQNITNAYAKRIQKEIVPTSDSYLSETCMAAKNGILEESKNLLVLKYQAGFLQAQASSQTKRIMQNLGRKIDTLWIEISAKYLKQLARSVNTWSNIV